MSWKDAFKNAIKGMKPEEKAQFKKATEKLFEDQVEDLWSGEMHKVPSGESIPFGPGQSASGKGAEVMMNAYSNPAPQQAVTGEYDKLASEMGRGFAEARKAIGQLYKNHEAIKSVLSILLKAEEEEEEKDKEEKCHEKARSFMKKAKISIRKAESAEDKEEKEDGKDELEKARINLKKAKDLLFKAEEEGEDEEEVEKSFSEHKSLSKKLKATDVFLKESFKDWAEEEDEEDAHKKKSVEKAEGKEEGDKGDQAGKPSKDGNQDDAAAKADTSAIEKTVKEIMDGIMSQSRGEAPTFSVAAKADPVAFIKAKRDKLEIAILNDELNLDEQCYADTLIGLMEKSVRGQVDEFVVEEKRKKAPAKVQSIFA